MRDMSLQRKAKLHTGAEIPLLGLGTWQAESEQVYEACKMALGEGYRHFDCAFIYGNEDGIGKALKQALEENKVKREDLFITSKLWNTFHRPEHVEPALDGSLTGLQVEYLDLYLMHWPYPQPFIGHTKEEVCNVTPEALDDLRKIPSIQNEVSLIETWRAMEKLVESGKAKHIGVSNFTVTKLKEILKDCKIPPAVNQVELHPYHPQHELLAFCKENNIHVTAYAPLGSFGVPRVMEDDTLRSIAEKNQTDPAHVLLAWGQQRGCSVVPKSSSELRIKANFQDIDLPQEDIQAINEISTRKVFFEVFPVFDE